MTTEKPDNNLTIDIEIDEEQDLYNVFINLKSDFYQDNKYTREQATSIIQSNGIVFKLDNDYWYGTDKSFLAINNIKSIETLQNLINIFDKYKNLIYYSYKSDQKFHLFVINRQLALDYYQKINNYYEQQVDLDENQDINVYLLIDTQIEQNSISNKSNSSIDTYLYLNDLRLAKVNDLEMIIPQDLSYLIQKVLDNQQLEDSEQSHINQFKLTLKQLIDQQDNYQSIQFKLTKPDETIDSVSTESLFHKLKIDTF